MAAILCIHRLDLDTTVFESGGMRNAMVYLKVLNRINCRNQLKFWASDLQNLISRIPDEMEVARVRYPALIRVLDWGRGWMQMPNM